MKTNIKCPRTALTEASAHFPKVQNKAGIASRTPSCLWAHALMRLCILGHCDTRPESAGRKIPAVTLGANNRGTIHYGSASATVPNFYHLIFSEYFLLPLSSLPVASAAIASLCFLSSVLFLLSQLRFSRALSSGVTRIVLLIMNGRHL